MPDALVGLAWRVAFRRPAPKFNYLDWAEEDAQVWQPLRGLRVLMLQDQHLNVKDMSVSTA